MEVTFSQWSAKVNCKPRHIYLVENKNFNKILKKMLSNQKSLLAIHNEIMILWKASLQKGVLISPEKQTLVM